MDCLITRPSRLSFAGYCVSTTWHGFSPAYLHGILRLSLHHKYRDKARLALMECFLSLSRCQDSSASRCDFVHLLNVLNAAVWDLIPVSSDRAERLVVLLNSLLRQGQKCLFELATLQALFEVVDLVMTRPSAPLMSALCLLFWLPEEMHTQEVDFEEMERRAVAQHPSLGPVLLARQQIAADPLLLEWDDRWPKRFSRFMWHDNFYALEYMASVPRCLLYPLLLRVIASFSAHRRSDYRVLFWVRHLLAVPLVTNKTETRKGRIGLLWWCCKVGFAFSSPSIQTLSQELLIALHENWHMTNCLFPLYQALVGCLWEETDFARLEQDNKKIDLMDFAALDDWTVDMRLEAPEPSLFPDLPRSDLMDLKQAVVCPRKKEEVKSAKPPFRS